MRRQERLGRLGVSVVASNVAIQSAAPFVCGAPVGLFGGAPAPVLALLGVVAGGVIVAMLLGAPALARGPVPRLTGSMVPVS